ncbi:hypothetical protein [Yinghuangia soli]|uniref:Uncharacterized protein n=1 Tax=Yinghuangia soli TaxID=2908204 RepID=A0AA41Q259_9ACTN|nr:hypothetical protein [Yinghuangia soli]MCF2529371.1 hypothetical protein [Yinghuangia soli]
MGLDPLPDPGTTDRYWLDRAVEAVNVSGPGTTPRVRELAPEADWPADVRTAFMMQAQRLFARRSSPTGVTGYTDAGPSYVARWDPDVERLLQIGSWAPGRIG